MPQNTQNPTSFRLPFILGEDVHKDVKAAIHHAFSALKDHNDAIVALAPQSGETSARPDASKIKIGSPFFDTTLGIPIVWNGTAWVNMSGTEV